MTNRSKKSSLLYAFAPFIAFISIRTMLSAFNLESVYVRLISNIAVIVIAGLYMCIVLQEKKPYTEIKHSFLLKSAVVILTFSLASLFTSNFILLKISDMGYMSVTGGEHMMLSYCISVFIAPFAEEIIFRGYMYYYLRQFGNYKAIIISSLVFALYHGTVVHIYAATIGGIIFCIIYYKTTKFTYSVLAHMLFNGLTVIYSLAEIPATALFTSAWFVIAFNIVLIITVVMICKTDGCESLTINGIRTYPHL